MQTARRLFGAEGYRAVGIDRIIAEADVAKTTLYKHFPSKDDLILAVLKENDRDVLEMFSRSIRLATSKGKPGLEGFFAALKKWFQSPEFRGCVFINAAVEMADAAHPSSQFATQHKHDFGKLLHEAVTADHGRKVADAVSPAIMLLVEGAITTAQMRSEPKSADVAKKAAISLIRSKESEA